VRARARARAYILYPFFIRRHTRSFDILSTKDSAFEIGMAKAAASETAASNGSLLANEFYERISKTSASLLNLSTQLVATLIS